MRVQKALACIWVIESARAAREALRELLEDSRFRVEVFANANEAVKDWEKEALTLPSVHVLLAEAREPTIPVDPCLLQLLQTLPARVRVIFMTTALELPRPLEGETVRKPIHFPELLRLLLGEASVDRRKSTA